MAASTVYWATPFSCLVLSERDSILCTNFEFCEGKMHRPFKNIVVLQRHAICDEKKFQEKSTYFRRWCKCCAIW